MTYLRCCSVACACRTELLELLILWWEGATDGAREGAREGAWLAILWWEGVGEEGGDMLSSMGVAGLDPPPMLGLEGLLTPGNYDQKFKKKTFSYVIDFKQMSFWTERRLLKV